MATELPRVYVTLKVPSEHLSPLEGIAEIIMPDNGVCAAPRAQTLSLISNCSALLSQGELQVDRELLDAAPQLRFVANAAMGIDNLDLAELRQRGILASNTPTAFAESTADHTLGLLLSLTRRVCESDRYVRTGAWAQRREPLRWEGTILGGKTLGIIGYGTIAKMDKTRHLINAEAISLMKPGSFFINVARGKVMDESAVVAALQSGHLAGAALDVFEEEPLVNEALFAMETVVLTPHIGGATREQRRRGRLEASGEIARFLKGEPLQFPV